MSSSGRQKVNQCRCKICQNSSDSPTEWQHYQINVVLSQLNEAQRRWYVGFLSQQPGGSSQRQLSLITGLDAKTIRRGRRELEEGLSGMPLDRQRQVGGGRHRIEKKSRN